MSDTTKKDRIAVLEQENATLRAALDGIAGVVEAVLGTSRPEGPPTG